MVEYMKDKDLCVLLISACENCIAEVEQKLQKTTGFSCYLRHCSELDNADSVIETTRPEIDVVLLDINMIHTHQPKKIFKMLEKFTQGAPIVVYDSTLNHNMELFLIQEGAADSVTKPDTDSNPHRLLEAIEHSMIRNKIIRRMQWQNAQEIGVVKTELNGRLKKVNRQNAARLEKTREDAEKQVREKEQVISWLCGSYSKEYRLK